MSFSRGRSSAGQSVIAMHLTFMQDWLDQLELKL